MMTKNQIVADALSEIARQIRSDEVSIASAGRMMKTVFKEAGLLDEPRLVMADVIERLFTEGATDDGQAPALNCAVVLAGGGMQIQGSLSQTPEGGLRMMCLQARGDAMTEFFFDVEAVISIAVPRTLKVEDSRIVLG